MGVSSKLFFSCHTIFIEVYTHHTHITAAYEMFYKDDDARGLLAVTFFFFLFMYILIHTNTQQQQGLAVSSLLNSDRFKENLVLGMLANLRITGIKGFGPPSETFANIVSNGWKSYYNTDYSNNTNVYSPHYQSYLWACYLWSFEKSNYQPFLTRAKNAIKQMMENYPTRWIPTLNGTIFCHLST